MRRENNRVFLLAMWMMFFAVSAFGQDSGLLNRYRSRALEYNQDVKAAEKNIALSKEYETFCRCQF